MPPTQLIEVVQRLSFCRNQPEVTGHLVRAARELTGADGVAVVLREGGQCHWVDEDALAPLWKGRRFPLETCGAGHALRHREQVVAPDVGRDRRLPTEIFRSTFVRSLVLTPIRRADPVGALGAYWKDHHEPSAQERELLWALADATALALANVQFVETLALVNQRKDELLAMLSHELRNPLAPIRNALAVLKRYGGDRQVLQRAQDLMERQMRHLAQMVDDMRDAARITTGRVMLDEERLDLARLVQATVEERRCLLEEGNLELAVDVPEVPVWVKGDPVRLSQVVANVLANARKFTPPGGRVAVGLSADGRLGQAVLTVRDTGIGISSDDLPHVFEVFTHEDERRRGKTLAGLGLGLSVARGLLQLHGGTIEARSDGRDQGTEVVVRLPLQPEPAALSGAPAPEEPELETGRLRVLVVDDNRDVAESLARLLTSYGHDVSVARSGREGVELAKRTHPHAVLCDLGLPGFDGFHVADALRHEPGTAHARLIAVTGYGRGEDREQVLAAGFDAHLVKPVDADVLLDELALAVRSAPGEDGAPAR